MSRVAVLGEAARVRGFALAGADVLVAADDDEVIARWQALDPHVGLLILTADAARTLGTLLAERPRLLWTVMPA
jgi:vacuolar-type H+-ATPase subunit F/Vma7